MEEFYTDELTESEQVQADSKAKASPQFHQVQGFVQDIQKGLQQHVRAVN